MNRKRILLGIISLVVLISTYVGLNYSSFQSVYSASKDITQKTENMKFMLGGQTVGIKLLASRCTCYGCGWKYKRY